MRSREVLRNEDYPTQANLTPEQKIFDQLWRDMKAVQQGKVRPSRIAMGFKPRPFGREVHPLTAAKPIRDLDSVFCVMMLPVPAGHWQATPSNRCYRFHTEELSAELKDGEVVFGTSGQVFDFAKSPLQDHQIFSLRTFNPGSVGAQIEQAVAEGQEGVKDASVLVSPLSGDMVTVRDDLFVKILIGGTIIYRFGLASEVDIVADKAVCKGDKVAQLVGKQTYQVAEMKRNGRRPRMDLIGPDMLSASRYKQLFRLCNSMLGGIVNDRDPYGAADTALPIEQVSKLLPKLLAVFPLPDDGGVGDWVDAVRAEGFEPSGELKKQILAAVQPGGSFGVSAPVDGMYTGVDDFGTYKQLNFRTVNGDVVTMLLPKCAVLHGPFADDQDLHVSKGDSIGDWVARDYYQSYDDLSHMAESGLIAIESAYLRSRAVVTGERGFEDEGIAVDARLVESVLHLAAGFKLDFTGLLTAADGLFFASADGTVGPVMVKTDHSHVRDIGICVNGLRYLPPMLGYVADAKQASQQTGDSRKHHTNK